MLENNDPLWIATLIMNKIPKWIIGELLGTFVMVFFGCGAVTSAVTSDALVGVFPVAIIWGLGVVIAIYLTASLSGAHLNPAVTVTMAFFHHFPKSRILPYILVQCLGAFLAAATVYLVFSEPLREFENANQITRGMPGSEGSAKVFGEYFPNPGPTGLTVESRAAISMPSAFAAEMIGTALLLMVILGINDPKNTAMPSVFIAPTIGLTVTLLICLLGPLTMACFNPARDFAPRLFSSLVGWRGIPFSTNGWGWLTVYIVAPTLGGLLGGFFYTKLLAPCYSRTES